MLSGYEVRYLDVGIQRAIEDLLLGLACLKGFTCYTLKVDQASSSFALEWSLGKVQVVLQAEQLTVRAHYGKVEVLQCTVPSEPEETLRVRLGAALHDAFVAVTHL
jgi:hypothetical protein